MLSPRYLRVYILKVVLVQGGHRPGSADPEVDSVRLFLQCDAGEGDVLGSVRE